MEHQEHEKSPDSAEQKERKEENIRNKKHLNNGFQGDYERIKKFLEMVWKRIMWRKHI